MDQDDTIALAEQPADSPTTVTGEAVPVARAGNVMPAFLAELARAMQAAAERERERIAGIVAAEAADHVEKARTRAAAESVELRRLADEDVERIQDWAATEMNRIRLEASRRTDERRSELAAYLAQHDSIIVNEVDGVDSAVREYRATLDQFFDELSGATDPAEIARRAGSLPAMPDLDGIRAAARGAAVAELANAEGDAGPLGVMDPDAVGRSGDHANPAVRLLRSIAPWTSPTEHESHENGTPTAGPGQPV